MRAWIVFLQMQRDERRWEDRAILQWLNDKYARCGHVTHDDTGRYLPWNYWSDPPLTDDQVYADRWL